MNINKTKDGSRLTLALDGRLDAETAPTLEEEITLGLAGIEELIFDFSGLDYVSSTGLRVLLKSQQIMNKQGRMQIENVSRDIMDVFEMTGFRSLMQVERAVRQISTEGLALIGRGVTGECYKVDNETLLKLYYEHVSKDMAEKEKAYAKAAFVAGIPTAISYDVVACGNRKGIVVEMVDAKTLSQVIVENQDKLEKYVKLFSDICKKVHTTRGDATVFPKTKDACRVAVEKVDFLNDAQRRAVLAKVEEIPDADTCIHGDLHPSNILMQGEKPCLIDMGDFSIGYPMFDIAQIYNIFYSSRITGISEKAVGMKPELAFRIWTLFEEYYFDTKSEADRLRVREEASVFGSLRMFMFYEAFGKEKNMKKWILERFIPSLQV